MTGVQTCALPILIRDEDRRSVSKVPGLGDIPVVGRLFSNNDTRSEERRVGKECRSRGSADH